MSFSIGIVQMENEITIELTGFKSKEEFAHDSKAAGGDEVILAVEPYCAPNGDDHGDVLAAMALCQDGIGNSLRHFAQRLFDLGREFERSRVEEK